MQAALASRARASRRRGRERRPALRPGLIRTQLEQLGRRMQRMDRVLLSRSTRRPALGAAGREIVERIVACGWRRHLAQSSHTALSARSRACRRPRTRCTRAFEHRRVASPDGPRIEAFVRPTGSGKTTTIAKPRGAARAEGLPASVLIVRHAAHRCGGRAGAYARGSSGAPLPWRSTPTRLRARARAVR